MRPPVRVTLLSLLSLALCAGAATAQKPAKEKGKPKAEAAPSGVAVTVTFSTDEHRILTDYFRQHPAGAKPLPPGIAKNLARGKPMPPGIAKRELPQAVITLLPPPPAGYHRSIVGDMIVLVSAAGVIVDVLHDILH